MVNSIPLLLADLRRPGMFKGINIDTEITDRVLDRFPRKYLTGTAPFPAQKETPALNPGAYCSEPSARFYRRFITGSSTL